MSDGREEGYLKGRFVIWRTRFESDLGLWPQPLRDLTAYIPKISKYLQKLLFIGQEIVDLLERQIIRTQRQRDTIQRFCKAFKELLHLISATLGALSWTYCRIHAQQNAAPVRVISYMWPVYRGQLDGTATSAFEDVVKHLKYVEACIEESGDDMGLPKYVREFLFFMCSQGEQTELLLPRVAEHGKRALDLCVEANTTLDDTDPEFTVQWEADDEKTEESRRDPWCW